MGSFPERPAIVAAAGHDIDFLQRSLPDISRPQFTGHSIERKPPGMSEAYRPKLGPHLVGQDCQPVEAGRADKRIVRRHGVAGLPCFTDYGGMLVGLEASRFPVHVNAQDRRIKIAIDVLCVVEGVIVKTFVAQGDVEETVRSEMQVPARVETRAVQLLEEHQFGSRIRNGHCAGIHHGKA